MPRRATQITPYPDRYGPNTAAIAATFEAVAAMPLAQLERLGQVQDGTDITSFITAWSRLGNDSRFDRLAFQRIVSAGYGVVDRRLHSFRTELSPAAEKRIGHAVIGRALALFGAPDITADEAMILSRAWTTVVG